MTRPARSCHPKENHSESWHVHGRTGWREPVRKKAVQLCCPHVAILQKAPRVKLLKTVFITGDKEVSAFKSNLLCRQGLQVPPKKYAMYGCAEPMLGKYVYISIDYNGAATLELCDVKVYVNSKIPLVYLNYYEQGQVFFHYSYQPHLYFSIVSMYYSSSTRPSLLQHIHLIKRFFV